MGRCQPWTGDPVHGCAIAGPPGRTGPGLPEKDWLAKPAPETPGGLLGTFMLPHEAEGEGEGEGAEVAGCAGKAETCRIPV